MANSPTFPSYFSTSFHHSTMIHQSSTSPTTSMRHTYSSDPSKHLISKKSSNSFVSWSTYAASISSGNATDPSPPFNFSTHESHQPGTFSNLLPPITGGNGITASAQFSTSHSILITPKHGRVDSRRNSDTSYLSSSEYNSTPPDSSIPLSTPPFSSTGSNSPSSYGSSRFAASPPQQTQSYQFDSTNLENLHGNNVGDQHSFTTLGKSPSSGIGFQDGRMRRTSSLSQILSSEEEYDDDSYHLYYHHNNCNKRLRVTNDSEGGEGDSEIDDDGDDCESSGSCGGIGCQESTITPCLSPLHIVSPSETNLPSSNISSTTVANSSGGSDTGSMLGEQPPQQILRQNKGLRHFSKQVCDKVEQKGITNYNEVADELADDFAAQMQENGGKKVDQKNIRRRVYDALNVLMAIDIIQKDKKEIRWLGLPDYVQAEASTSSAVSENDAEIERQKIEIKQLERENRQLAKDIDVAKIAVQQKQARHIQIKNLIKRNYARDYSMNKYGNQDKKVLLPFALVRCPRGTIVDIKQNPDSLSQTLSFHPHRPAIIDDTEILETLGFDKITPEDMSIWVNPEHLKWLVTSQNNEGDYIVRGTAGDFTTYRNTDAFAGTNSSLNEWSKYVNARREIIAMEE